MCSTRAHRPGGSPCTPTSNDPRARSEFDWVFFPKRAVRPLCMVGFAREGHDGRRTAQETKP